MFSCSIGSLELAVSERSKTSGRPDHGKIYEKTEIIFPYRSCIDRVNQCKRVNSPSNFPNNQILNDLSSKACIVQPPGSEMGSKTARKLTILGVSKKPRIGLAGPLNRQFSSAIGQMSRAKKRTFGSSRYGIFCKKYAF